jgi:DNA (cytosine-5)-methyltransferase 1
MVSKPAFRPRLGELFSGPGGLGLGAHLAGFDHAWAVDLDPSACQTYLNNIPGATKTSVICGDVTQVKLNELPPIDALAFGFPCNDFSLVGEQKGLEGSFGPLYQSGVKVLKHHKPLVFMAENVGGLMSANGGQAFIAILADLEAAGYKVHAQLYKCEDYGVPQRRHRVIFVGFRNDLDHIFTPPAPLTPHATQRKSSRQALANIPSSAPNHEKTRQHSRVVERLKHIKPGQNAFTADMPEELKLQVKGATISQIYRRLNPDLPSYTVTGSGGGGTHLYHWEEDRALTSRERARLQTFPDDYVFYGTKEAVRKQIGMAVPPVFAEQLCRAVLDQLFEVSAKTDSGI